MSFYNAFILATTTNISNEKLETMPQRESTVDLLPRFPKPF
jgi:hypothetical protein